MTNEVEREAARVRKVYDRRAGRGLDSRYDYWQPANLFIYQARERALLSLLTGARALPIGDRRVLDVGCGDGSVLQDFLRSGAIAENLYGCDLLPGRIESARARLPGATLETADAQSLSYEDGFFDIVLAFTLLSSVLDDAARHRIARELVRVTRTGGRIVIYDFWLNPFNRDVRPLRRDALGALFPGRRIDFRRTTLAPPLVRALVKAPGGRFACSVLEMIPFLNTHYVAAVYA